MRRITQQGFTLLEMLLVSAIAIAMLGLLINYTTQSADESRRNKTVMDMQQILNAALSYYNQHGDWPTTTACTTETYNQSATLQTAGYLPNINMLDASANNYQSFVDNQSNFVVIAKLGNTAKQVASALIIAGQLPTGYTTTSSACPPAAATCTAGTDCYAASQVPPPGQNLNNARSLNFAGVYNVGGCVPEPSCPTGMTAEIIAVPASATGLSNSGAYAYPITSFTAYATPASTTPNTCFSNTPASCPSTPAGRYWRVCLQLQTVQFPGSTLQNENNLNTTSSWAKIAAFTRCAPSGENAGSNLSVFNIQ